MKKYTLFLMLCMMTKLLVFAQNTPVFTQNIKGIVRDADAKSPLIGAAVVVVGVSPMLGAVTNTEGVFKIEKTPVGRYDLQISFIGYEPVTVPQVLVTSGKEVFLTIDLKESVQKLNEIGRAHV